MSFLFDLIIRREFKAINDLFNNVVFDYSGFIDGEPDSYDIIKMQFSFGFIYGLIILSDKNVFNNDDKNNLKSLINCIKDNFLGVYSQNEIIEYFKKYYDLSSNVRDVYCCFDFRFENKKYRNSWSGIHVDETYVLKEYIYVFGINYSNLEDINSILISKDCKHFYERLLKLIKLEEKSKLDTLLDIEMNKDSLIKLLNVLISECKKAEAKFIRDNKISVEKTENFKNIIFKEIENGNELILYLKDNSKYSIINKRNKKLFGFNQIIGRNLFFDDVYGLDNIAKNYGHAILNGISEKYLKKLDSISEVIKEDFVKYIDSLNKKEKIVIIASPSNCRLLNLKKISDKIVDINGRKVDLIKVSKARDIYVIKKKDLPKVNMFEPDITEPGTYLNGVYYNLLDLSTNGSEKTEIQKIAKWLGEKGSIEEQIEYLKGKCDFKLFISLSIRKISNSKCYKFIIKEGDE